jgi:hypothetical protein
MCHFPGFPPRTLCVQVRVTRHYPCRVPPFGDPCFIARLRLHTAYRSLPRPSSAFGAKASTIRPYYLNGMDFTLCSFQRPDAYALAGAKKEWHVAVATPAAPEPEKALKTEQQLLDQARGTTLRRMTGRSILERSTGTASWPSFQAARAEIIRWPIGRALLLYLLPRKEVIQPHLQVRLPCYDFTPVAGPTFADRLLKRGWPRRLRVLPTPVV